MASTGHYIAEAEREDYNPWGGRTGAMYPDAQLAAAMQLPIAVIGVYPDAKPIPDPPLPEEDDIMRSLPIPGAPTGANTFVVALPTSDEVVVIAWDHTNRTLDTIADLKGQLHTLEEALYDEDDLIIRGVNAKDQTWRYDSSQNPTWRQL